MMKKNIAIVMMLMLSAMGAWRKGVTYGSIVIDYETGWPIDLLVDRETESFRQWLEGHEKVSVVSRDRSTDYSSAVASTGRSINE